MIEVIPKVALIAALAWGLNTCDSSPAKPANAELNEPFTLAIGQTATVEGADFDLTFVDVLADSRCAVDVQCVWEGEATIRLRVAPRGEAAQTFDLTTRGNASTVVHGGFRISFEELAPPTHSERPIAKSDYRAVLRVAAGAGPAS